ncbi:DEAD-box ATP-dependent RNA helicase 18 isoform A [Chlorella sorokiniana]|uniref:DEAD-box ATP-dependent RNA helicase 18 isoform A n=1 Tax=Chlorella sorokiniana TaxID=3076 RepID=A0A2P6TDB8_CHLSO|nr:DEAD-box ATP-dependent RNA helicase 18 isoform A [Chlorella sorokiniana]|eukprot:PRW20639.1 DEAD-box ATP-dependent RNA helicase 18 isoform A [Chlorella sorokiniana]
MEAGTKAFVSYVRAYKEHHCKFIFRPQDLALGRLASAFALLRLPRMPEIKQGGKGLEGFTPSTVDPDTVRFRDKAREKQRQAVRKQQAKERQAGAEQQQSQQRQRKAALPEVHLPAAKRRKQREREELEEMDREYALLTKLRRGKITAHEYDVAAGLASDSE